MELIRISMEKLLVTCAVVLCLLLKSVLSEVDSSISSCGRKDTVELCHSICNCGCYPTQHGCQDCKYGNYTHENWTVACKEWQNYQENNGSPSEDMDSPVTAVAPSPKLPTSINSNQGPSKYNPHYTPSKGLNPSKTATSGLTTQSTASVDKTNEKHPTNHHNLIAVTIPVISCFVLIVVLTVGKIKKRCPEQSERGLPNENIASQGETGNTGSVDNRSTSSELRFSIHFSDSGSVEHGLNAGLENPSAGHIPVSSLPEHCLSQVQPASVFKPLDGEMANGPTSSVSTPLNGSRNANHDDT